MCDTLGKRETNNATRNYFNAAAQTDHEVCAAVAAAFQSETVTRAIERACDVDLDEVIRLRSRAVISHAGTVVSIEDDGDPATLSATARLALGGHCTPKGLNPLGLHVYHLDETSSQE